MGEDDSDAAGGADGVEGAGEIDDQFDVDETDGPEEADETDDQVDVDEADGPEGAKGMNKADEEDEIDDKVDVDKPILMKLMDWMEQVWLMERRVPMKRMKR